MTRKLIISKLWPSVLFFFLAIRPAGALTIPRISADLNNDRVAIGETVLLAVTVTWIGPASAFLFLPPQPPECRGLTVTGTAQRSIVYRTDGDPHQVRDYLFSLRGDVEGSGRVGQVRLLYRRGGEEEEHSLTTEPLEVPVAPGGKGIFSSFGAALRTIGIGLVVIVVMALYIRWTIRRYQKKSNEVIADYVKNLETESLKELDHVRKYKVQGDIEKYLEKIWTVLADYLEKKYTITISPESSRELLGGARASALPGEAGEELARILKELEECRFGSSRLESRELDTILKRVYAFIESQKNHSAD